MYNKKHMDVVLKAIACIYYDVAINGTVSDEKLYEEVFSFCRTSMGDMINGGEKDVVSDLIDFGLELIDMKTINIESILLSLSIILEDKNKVFFFVEKMLNSTIELEQMKIKLSTLQGELNKFKIDTELIKYIKTLSFNLATGKVEIDGDLKDEIINKMTSLKVKDKSKKRTGNILDFNSVDDALEIVNNAKKNNSPFTRLRTGWWGLNKMLGGGFLPGETVLTSALPHRNKSGFARSLFAQLATFNKASDFQRDSDKTPTLVFISLEDNISIVVLYIYNYLYHAEFGHMPDLNTKSSNEIVSYLKNKLTFNGFAIKIMYLSPSENDYQSITNILTGFEDENLELTGVFIDYLYKLPPTGIANDGVIGTVTMNLFSKFRDFFSVRETFFLSPHQLSGDAKALLRNGVSDVELVKLVKDRGYYENSKRLDQVVDVEIHHHIAYIDGKPFFTVQRGKRRYNEIIDEEDKFFMMKFPYKAPIPPDIDFEGNRLVVEEDSSNSPSNFTF